MNKQLRSNKIVDLTPLLDVVLILLFALLMNMSVEQEDYKDEANELKTQVMKVDQENEELNKIINQLQSNIDTLDEQSQVINEAVVTWFASEKVRDSEVVTSEDFGDIFDAKETNQSLYQMDYIANQFFFVEIEVDTKHYHEVIINDVPTGIQLTLDKRTQPEKDEAADEIFDEIEKILSSKDGGYKFVLFTLTDNGEVYYFSYDLLWDVIKRIEEKHMGETIYKLKYLDY